MATTTLIIGLALRIILPAGLLFWISARLRAWDHRQGGVSC